MRIVNDKPAPFVVEFWDTSSEDDAAEVVRELPADTLDEALTIGRREAESYKDHIQICEHLHIHLEQLEDDIYEWTYDDYQSHDI